MEMGAGSVFSREFHWSEIWKRQIHWRGVTCWKCPLDLWSYQQIVFATRPQAIVECGVAMGGTTLFLADMLDLLGDGLVYGIDKDLQWLDQRAASHPRISVMQGDSADPSIRQLVSDRVRGLRTMVILDSEHDTEHVLTELRAYADLVTPGCYLVCEDAILDRSGDPSVSGYRGPFGALQQFLSERSDFIHQEDCVLGATFNPGGYLLRTVTEA